MPAGAVSGVSWILCAFAFLVTVRGLVGGAPGRPSPIHPWKLIPSVLRSLAARFEIAREKALFGAAVAPESSDLGSPIHFLCCAAGPGIAAALSGAH